jgi:signal transduction histidine kinase
VPIALKVALTSGEADEEKSSIAVMVDITERRKAEQLRRDLAAMLSHDMKNPLGAVVGLAEILRDDLPENLPEQREIIDRIEIAARRALALAVNFVDAERIESGAIELHRAKTALGDVVLRTVDEQSAAARARRITVESDVGGPLPELEVDRQMFERIVANLLSNALKHSPKSGRVRVSLARRGEDLELSVADDGPGITAEQRAKLFERFSQGSRPSGRNSSGLGLFIVKTLTDAHGGRVSLECPATGGSIFRVLLPMDPRSHDGLRIEARGGSSTLDDAGIVMADAAATGGAP